MAAELDASGSGFAPSHESHADARAAASASTLLPPTSQQQEATVDGAASASARVAMSADRAQIRSRPSSRSAAAAASAPQPGDVLRPASRDSTWEHLQSSPAVGGGLFIASDALADESPDPSLRRLFRDVLKARAVLLTVIENVPVTLRHVAGAPEVAAATAASSAGEPVSEPLSDERRQAIFMATVARVQLHDKQRLEQLAIEALQVQDKKWTDRAARMIECEKAQVAEHVREATVALEAEKLLLLQQIVHLKSTLQGIKQPYLFVGPDEKRDADAKLAVAASIELAAREQLRDHPRLAAESVAAQLRASLRATGTTLGSGFTNHTPDTAAAAPSEPAPGKQPAAMPPPQKRNAEDEATQTRPEAAVERETQTLDDGTLSEVVGELRAELHRSSCELAAARGQLSEQNALMISVMEESESLREVLALTRQHLEASESEAVEMRKALVVLGSAPAASASITAVPLAAGDASSEPGDLLVRDAAALPLRPSPDDASTTRLRVKRLEVSLLTAYAHIASLTSQLHASTRACAPEVDVEVDDLGVESHGSAVGPVAAPADPQLPPSPFPATSDFGSTPDLYPVERHALLKLLQRPATAPHRGSATVRGGTTMRAPRALLAAIPALQQRLAVAQRDRAAAEGDLERLAVVISETRVRMQHLESLNDDLLRKVAHLEAGQALASARPAIRSSIVSGGVGPPHRTDAEMLDLVTRVTERDRLKKALVKAHRHQHSLEKTVLAYRRDLDAADNAVRGLERERTLLANQLAMLEARLDASSRARLASRAHAQERHATP